MLATAGKNPDELVARLSGSNRFTWDVKWDGIRALAYVLDGTVKLRNRNGEDITHRYPDLVGELLAVYPAGQRVFDGEILVWDGQRFDFRLAGKRDAQSSARKIAECAEAYPATYMAFDMLWHDGLDLRSTGLDRRLDALSREPTSEKVRHSQFSEDGQAMWAAVDQFGFEGLIAKERHSRYHGGRQLTWVKAKRLQRITCIATGYEPGKGHHAGKIGCIKASVYDGDRLIEVGEVGTGFTDADHRMLLPFLQNGTRFLIEVEFLELTRDRRMRHPSFKGIRTDRTAADCTIEQVRT